jgi:hypothetical protein
MNSKVANLIALELGVLIAIMAWLAFSNLRSVKSQPIAQEPERTVDSFATVAPVIKSTNRRPVVDYRADLPAEPQQEEPSAQTVQEYDQAVATEPYPSSSLDDGYIAETSPYYDVVDPEPLLTLPDCLLSPVDQFVVYPQSTAFIIVSNSPSFGRRPRSPARPGGAPTMVAHRRPPTVEQSHGRGGRIAPGQNIHIQASRPIPKVRPRQMP